MPDPMGRTGEFINRAGGWSRGENIMRNGMDDDAMDQAGAPWRLADALGRGAVVLVFYRGDW